MLRYPEVYSDLNFVAVPTMPLEVRTGVDKGLKEISDSSETGKISDIIRKEKNVDGWRYHTDSENLFLSDIEKCNLTIDKISQFSIRPPELRSIIDQPGTYYRWFKILPKQMTEKEMRKRIKNDIDSSYLIDGMQRIVLLREKAIPELNDYINNEMHHHDKETFHIKVMIDIFKKYSLTILTTQIHFLRTFGLTMKK